MLDPWGPETLQEMQESHTSDRPPRPGLLLSLARLLYPALGLNCWLQAPRISVIDLQPLVHASSGDQHHAPVGISCDSG